MEDKLLSVIANHEERLKKIEVLVFSKNAHSINPIGKYKGLAGGIRLLIKNGFFKKPRSLKDIKAELKREGYSHTISGISSTLTTTFVKSQKILKRMHQEKTWKYLLRDE